MAINFPATPADGTTFTDPTGRQWVYEAANTSWTAKGGAAGGMVYKGGIDVTTAPPAGVQSGWLYVVTTGGTVNAGYTGLTGVIPAGSQVVFGGPNWQLLSAPAGWARTGTELAPTNAGDSVFTSGAMKVGGTTVAPNIQLYATGVVGCGTSSKNFFQAGVRNAAMSYLALEASDDVAGYDANQPGIYLHKLRGGAVVGSPFQVFWDGRVQMVSPEIISGDAKIKLQSNSGNTFIGVSDAGSTMLSNAVPKSLNIVTPAGVHIGNNQARITLDSVGGNIWYAGTLTPPSDATLKEGIVDADLNNQWEDIKRVQLRKYQWKAEPERGTMLGVIAQELETVSPGLVLKDIGEDGNVVEGSCKVKVDALYMKMLGALQVAQQRIEALEAEVKSLKAGTP